MQIRMVPCKTRYNEKNEKVLAQFIKLNLVFWGNSDSADSSSRVYGL